MPEARIPLADAVILVATAPKSNTGYAAINKAMADVKNGDYGPIPRQLQNKHYDGEDAEVKGQFYIYPHDPSYNGGRRNISHKIGKYHGNDSDYFDSYVICLISGKKFIHYLFHPSL